jgi:hypothetical protein
MEFAGLPRPNESPTKATDLKTQDGVGTLSEQLTWLDVNPPPNAKLPVTTTTPIEQAQYRVQDARENWGAQGFDLRRTTVEATDGKPVTFLPDGTLPPGTYKVAFPNGRQFVVDVPPGLTANPAPVMFLWPGVSLPGQVPEGIRDDAHLEDTVDSLPSNKKFIVVTMLTQMRKLSDELPILSDPAILGQMGKVGKALRDYSTKPLGFWVEHGALVPNLLTDLLANQVGYYDDYYAKAVFDLIPKITHADPGDPEHRNREWGHMAFSQGCAMVNRLLGSEKVPLAGYFPYVACVAGTIDIGSSEPNKVSPGNALSVTAINTGADQVLSGNADDSILAPFGIKGSRDAMIEFYQNNLSRPVALQISIAQDPNKHLKVREDFTRAPENAENAQSLALHPDQDVRLADFAGTDIANGKCFVRYQLLSAEHLIPGPGKKGPLTAGGIPGNETVFTGPLVASEFNTYLDLFVRGVKPRIVNDPSGKFQINDFCDESRPPAK